MNIAQIEDNIKQIIEKFDEKSFIFDFLLAYEMPKATITRLKKSELNRLESQGELLLRKYLFFKVTETSLLHITIDELQGKFSKEKKSPRFIMVTDYDTLLAVDTKTGDTLDIGFNKLPRYYDFFLPLAGMEKSQVIDENPADVKAAEKMAKLYDEIIKDNEIESDEDVHALNVFLTRLLFCYFAEDSGIFAGNQFTNAILKYTQEDGSDIDSFLQRLFEVLDLEHRDESLPEYLRAFPYVNGQLFAQHLKIPKFSAKSRHILLELGLLDWSVINPDIFGSMIQTVITPEHRGGMGMHYTSVPNIMKVIEPLFLNELYEEFEEAKGNTAKLNKLHQRITKLKIFDPACGSGNFLIIAYKELRKLEMKIFKEGGLLISPSIKLSQFYGIELDDFAHEVAKLSLWLAEHQMNVLFKEEFGTVPPPLPLSDSGNIVLGNACRIDWDEVCPKEAGDEIYVLGNPPYQGSGKQSSLQKEDMAIVFNCVQNYKKLDYIACWFYKGAKYIKNSNAKLAFVTTNSVSQGEQVCILWKYIFNEDIEIFLAYQSFKWKNNAKANAGVSVTIIGLRNIEDGKKYIYQGQLKKEAKNINAYLVDSENIVVKGARKNLSNLPEMIIGSKASDDGHLILSETEKNELISKNQNIEKFIKKYIGAKDFMNSQHRYCIWVTEQNKQEALLIPELASRFEKVKNFRLASKKQATRKKAQTPYYFDEQKYEDSNSIVIPQTTSENREYIPIGFLNNEYVISNGLRIVYNAKPWLFAILTSKLHNIWVQAVSGRLETRIQYSNTICYNTFPFPNITKSQKELLAEHTFRILEERERYSEKTLAQLYDPEKMPEGLRQAHYELDLAVERCYRKKPFTSDKERLEYLFKLYQKMVRKEK